MPFVGPAGTASNPSFEVEPGTGIYSSGDGVGAASANTAQVFTWNSDGTLRLAATRGFYLASSAIINTAPTIASGFGASPSIVASNGSAAFTINVGTGGTASAGVITMPTAANGWVCHVENITQTAANRANVRTVQTASTTTSITVQNQTISTGAAVAWTASDVLRVIAIAY